jgi:hypothetical protein
MSAFGGLILTNKGRALQAKVQAGAVLHFNRIGIGDGNLASQSISELNALITEKKSLAITKLKTQSGGKAIVGGVLSNQAVVVGFYFREIGVFAQDPTDGEILYCYANAGAGAEYIPATGGPDIVEKNIDVITLTANAANVTADVASGIYALAEDVGDMSTVPTTSKVVAGAITELFTNVSDLKTKVAAAVTDMGVPTSEDDIGDTMAANIRAIETGPDTSDATVVAGDLRFGDTAYGAAGTKITGTLPVQATGPVTAVTADVVLPAGIYDAPITVKGDPDKVSANIRATANIDGVAGKAEVVDTTTAVGASAAQILAGREGFENGIKRIGTIPVVAGGNTITPSTVNQTAIAANTYATAAITVLGDPDLIAPNILNTAIIYNVQGTAVAGKRWASGRATSSASAVITVTGLAFQPKLILLRYSGGISPDYEGFGIVAVQTLFSSPPSNLLRALLATTAGTVTLPTYTISASGFSMTMGTYTSSLFDWIAIE